MVGIAIPGSFSNALKIWEVRNFPLDFLGQVRNIPRAKFSPAEESPYRTTAPYTHICPIAHPAGLAEGWALGLQASIFVSRAIVALLLARLMFEDPETRSIAVHLILVDPVMGPLRADMRKRCFVHCNVRCVGVNGRPGWCFVTPVGRVDTPMAADNHSAPHCQHVTGAERSSRDLFRAFSCVEDALRVCMGWQSFRSIGRLCGNH